jgi:hypothetical protein
VITPTQFNQFHGSGWVLMDGRTIDQQVGLRKVFDWTNVSDAGGVFIRGLIVVREKGTGDTGSDAQNNRAVDSYQNDVFTSHFHHLCNGDTGRL